MHQSSSTSYSSQIELQIRGAEQQNSPTEKLVKEPQSQESHLLVLDSLYDQKKEKINLCEVASSAEFRKLEEIATRYGLTFQGLLEMNTASRLFDRLRSQEQKRTWTFFISSLVVFLLILALLTMVFLEFPVTEIKRSEWSLMYGELGFPWSSFWIWITTTLMGFFYVSMVLCGRPKGGHGRDGSYRDIILVFFGAIGFYFIAPIFCIALPSDAETPSYWDAYIRNYFGFECVFFVALHFGTFNRCLVIRRAGTKFNRFKWSKCTTSEYLVALIGLMLVAASLGYHIYLLSADLELLMGYGIAYLGFVIGLCLITCLFRKIAYLSSSSLLFGLFFITNCSIQ